MSTPTVEQFMKGSDICDRIEAAIPGAHAEYGYMGVYRAGVTVWHDASGHPSGRPLYSFDCDCKEWGGGKLKITPARLAELIEIMESRIAAERPE